MKMSHRDLGLTMKDVVTGFEGVAIGYVQYLTGCNQVLLTPKVNSKSKGDACWFDESRLKVLSKPRVELIPPIPSKQDFVPTGFAEPAPTKR